MSEENKKEDWFKIVHIYKDAEINITSDMEPYQIDEQMAILDDAESITVNKWIIPEDVYSVEEATEKAKFRHGTGDLYLIYISGDSPMHCVIKDIEDFLSKVGPKRRS